MTHWDQVIHTEATPDKLPPWPEARLRSRIHNNIDILRVDLGEWYFELAVVVLIGSHSQPQCGMRETGCPLPLILGKYVVIKDNVINS